MHALQQTGEEPPREWKFYDQMHDVLKDKPRTKPVAIASSLRGANNMKDVLLKSKGFVDDSSNESDESESNSPQQQTKDVA